jgi:prophage maintenance system killer protein
LPLFITGMLCASAWEGFAARPLDGAFRMVLALYIAKSSSVIVVGAAAIMCLMATPTSRDPEFLLAKIRSALAALLGNLDQTVFGSPAYPTIESKAAHLLYFVVKNHPFTDGNKRIGSFLFVEFLHRNGRLVRAGEPVINDVGLAALALLVAESAPKDKEVMIRLVMNMLAEHT